MRAFYFNKNFNPTVTTNQLYTLIYGPLKYLIAKGNIYANNNDFE